MGVDKQGNVLHVVDFGLAKEFSEAERYKDVEGLRLGGTLRYGSINYHMGRCKLSVTSVLRVFAKVG